MLSFSSVTCLVLVKILRGTVDKKLTDFSQQNLFGSISLSSFPFCGRFQ